MIAVSFGLIKGKQLDNTCVSSIESVNSFEYLEILDFSSLIHKVYYGLASKFLHDQVPLCIIFFNQFGVLSVLSL